MPEVTTSRGTSQEQIIASIRNIRRDLDGIEKELADLANIRGTDEITGAFVNAQWRLAEGRMWLGRALGALGEHNSEDDDKAEEPREKVAPARRKDIGKTDNRTGEEDTVADND